MVRVWVRGSRLGVCKVANNTQYNIQTHLATTPQLCTTHTNGEPAHSCLVDGELLPPQL